MMIDPPIEKLREIAGNEYILTNVISKRAKILEKEIPEVIENSPEKAISIAARELVSGKLEIKKEDKNASIADSFPILPHNVVEENNNLNKENESKE